MLVMCRVSRSLPEQNEAEHSTGGAWCKAMTRVGVAFAAGTSSSQGRTLPVVAIVSQVLLGPQQQQLPVEHEEAAVVTHTAVHDREAHVAHDAVCEAVPH